VLQVHTGRVVTCRPQEFRPRLSSDTTNSESDLTAHCTTNLSSLTSSRTSHIPMARRRAPPRSAPPPFYPQNTVHTGARHAACFVRHHPSRFRRFSNNTIIPIQPQQPQRCSSQPDAAKWAQAYDACIYPNFALGAWTPCATPPDVKSVQPIWDFKAKTIADGSLDKRSVRCAARGDLMIPGVHYDPSRTAA
jgi:hypothetical protein